MFPEIFLSNIAQIYILPVLDKQGFRALSSREQEEILKPLIEGAIVRMVAGITGELSEQGKERFKSLANVEEDRNEIWQEFWREHLPEYEKVVVTTLQSYQEEIGSALTA